MCVYTVVARARPVGGVSTKSQPLSRIGATIIFAPTVADDRNRLAAIIQRARSRCIIFTSDGGVELSFLEQKVLLTIFST